MNPDDLKNLLDGLLSDLSSLEKQLTMNFKKHLYDIFPDRDNNPSQAPRGIALFLDDEGEEGEGLFTAAYKYTKVDGVACDPENMAQQLTEKQVLFLLSAGIETIIQMQELTEEDVEAYLIFLKGLLVPKFKNKVLYFDYSLGQFAVSENGVLWEAVKLTDFVDMAAIVEKLIAK